MYVSPLGLAQQFLSFRGLGSGKRVRLGLLLVWHAVIWTNWNSRNDIIFSGTRPVLESLRFCGGVEPEAVCGAGAGVGSLPPFIRPPLEMSLCIFFPASVIALSFRVFSLFGVSG